MIHLLTFFGIVVSAFWSYMSRNDFSLRDFSVESPKKRKAPQQLLLQQHMHMLLFLRKKIEGAMFYVVELSLTRNEQSSLISQPLCLFCFTSSCRARKKRDQGKKIPAHIWLQVSQRWIFLQTFCYG